MRFSDIKLYSNGRTIINAPSFDFEEGKISFLFGESGIGKSLLCKTVLGVLNPAELSGQINGLDYPEYRNSSECIELMNRSFFVFQEPSTHLNPTMMIAEQLELGLLADSAAPEETMNKLWTAYGDIEFKHKILNIFPKPFRPSGGEKQRVLLTMAFSAINKLQRINNIGIPVYVFDEPTGNLDNQVRNGFLSLLYKMHCEKAFTAIVITHDYSIISEINNGSYGNNNYTCFRELKRNSDGMVVLSNFASSRYSEWISTVSSISSKNRVSAPVLKINGGFSMFGKKYFVSKWEDKKKPVELEINSGEVVYLKAGSGVGKTTLARTIIGLNKSNSINMEIKGLSINEQPIKFDYRRLWGKTIGMVFQHADESLDLKATVFETFSGLPLMESKNRKKILGFIRSLFDVTTGDSFLDVRVEYLSGGQRQRLNLLRTMALETDLTILDEPLNGLDFDSSLKVLSLIREKTKKGKSFLVISHNEDIFDAIAGTDRTYYLIQANLT